MIYSYKKITTPGPQGTTYTYRPAVSEFNFDDSPKSTHLVEFEGLHYRHVPDGLEVPEQDPKIEWTPVDMSENERLSIVIRQFLDPVRDRDAYADCLTVQGLRAFLLLEVESEAAKFEANLNKDMYFKSSLKFRVNGDRRTSTNIQNLIAFYDLPPNSGKPVPYRDYDNELHSLTKEQLQTLFGEHTLNGNTLYEQKWQKQEALRQAKTIADLKAVDLTFKMADYTGKAAESEERTHFKPFNVLGM